MQNMKLKYIELQPKKMSLRLELGFIGLQTPNHQQKREIEVEVSPPKNGKVLTNYLLSENKEVYKVSRQISLNFELYIDNLTAKSKELFCVATNHCVCSGNKIELSKVEHNTHVYSIIFYIKIKITSIHRQYC
jgi:hypothetical protein